jgi:hypothetical protein
MTESKKPLKKKSPKPSKRKLPLATHRSFRLSKKRLKQPKKILNPLRLFKDTLVLLKGNKILFGGIALINFALAFIFVQGLATSFDLPEIKQNIEGALGAENTWATTLVLLGYLVGNGGSSGDSATGSTYQFLLVVITSLAVIWSARQVLAGERPRIRDSYYRGMYPLIPFILLLFVIALQLLPLIIGNLIYSTIVQNGLALTAVEQVLWLLLFISFALLSWYMIASSIFSLYISTLPDMTPFKALRSARELVLHRRIQVALRILALPVIIGIFVAALIIPLLIIAPLLAQIIFLLLTNAALVFANVYMYLLYRSLL